MGKKNMSNFDKDQIVKSGHLVLIISIMEGSVAEATSYQVTESCDTQGSLICVGNKG